MLKNRQLVILILNGVEQVLEKLGRRDEARQAYQDGMAAARAVRNDHALSELTQAAEALKGP